MFDVVLAGHPVARRGRFAAPAAVAAHVLVLGAALAVSAWKIGDVPEPTVPIVFAAPASPPAASTLPEKRGVPDRHPASAASPAPRVLPRWIPAIAPPIATSPLPATSGGDSGAGPETDALPNGVTGVPGSADGAGSVSGEVLSARSPNVIAPRLVREVAPEYPESARRAHLHGVVVLQAVIGVDGSVDDVRVLSSPSPLFEEPAVRSFRQWRYSAATLDGRAVRVYLTATISFALR